MNAHLERARLLHLQRRHAEAEQELRQSLVSTPGDPDCLALLALCLSEQNKLGEACSTIRQAISVIPDSGHLHYIHAHILVAAERYGPAFSAINEAIRLDSGDDDYFAQLSIIQLNLDNLQESLKAAEQALRINPENIEAANFRSMALIRLGRKDEAHVTMDYALERDPDNALSHASQGWNELHRNNPKKALEHFRESLRLQPDYEYARLGMLEALKANNLIYRGMLAYSLWMGRQSSKIQWTFIIGTLVAQRILRVTAQKYPQISVFIWPVLICFYGFIFLSWVATPLFNLFLRFNRFGRLVLSADERKASNWFALPLIGTIGGLVAFACGWSAGVIMAAVCAATAICVSAVFTVLGSARIQLALGTSVIFILGILGCILIAMGYKEPGNGLLGMLTLGFLGFQFWAIALQKRA
ncbi:MAG: tetratricopeptide repeat protein [Puniceicoccales bacterium]|jgi:tetratricopeptide (TPR) repeat protein|nr:tetratricopeptide repeat protein [Puniceicoccales bacterium]